MNLIDTSGWLEYFTAGPNWHHFGKAIKNIEYVIVPTIVIYEVFKKISVNSEEIALHYIAQMRLGHIVDLDLELAMTAAELSISNKLAMADSIILATAKKYGATLLTMDSDFKGIKGVKYFKK